MFYKKQDNNWQVGSEIEFPDGMSISPQNKQNNKGWAWHDSPPRAYLLEAKKQAFEKAFEQKNKLEIVEDIETLVISDFIIENRKDKKYGVAFYIDGGFFWMDNISYSGFLTENEIVENLIIEIEKI